MPRPGKNNSTIIARFENSGAVDGGGRRGSEGEGGKPGTVEMHVAARVTTRKSPPSSRRIQRRGVLGGEGQQEDGQGRISLIKWGANATPANI